MSSGVTSRSDHRVLHGPRRADKQLAKWQSGMTERFSFYDRRCYPTMDVAAGYAAWAPSYDATMDDRLDLSLLSALTAPDWTELAAAIDLACGTGRIGAWLKARGVRHVDGVDASPAMLARAAAKGIYGRLACADATATGLGSGDYDLAISSFAVCHF